MRIAVLGARVPTPPVAPPAWRPFVIAALICTVTAGALTGAIDLWTLRVSQAPVPVDHHRGHGFAQLFGFLGLFTLGISLQLAPRFFGQGPASRALVRRLAWSGIGGVVCFIIGRLGALVPGSAVFGLVGAWLVFVTQATWARLVWSFWTGWPHEKDALQKFLLAGVGWWTVAGAALFAWQVGEQLGGPLASVPLEVAWAAALYGGTGSWLWGIFFRAGLCTLKVRRPKEAAQARLFVAWQLAVALAVLAAGLFVPWLSAVAQLALAGGVALLWFTVRPFSGELGGEVALQPRAVQGGLVGLLVFAVLATWSAVATLAGTWAPPLLGDSVRHAFTLGVMTLVFGFAGRMVPGFSGVVLRWPRVYDAGVMAVGLGTALRLAQALGMSKAAYALAGASGGVLFLGVALVVASLLGSLAKAPRPVVAPDVRAVAG
jgi:hypothetical protein